LLVSQGFQNLELFRHILLRVTLEAYMIVMVIEVRRAHICFRNDLIIAATFVGDVFECLKILSLN
jgi:hypothetical protein